MASLLLVVIMAAVTSAQIGRPDPPTVDEVILEKYYGRWYQTHTTPVVLNTYEKDCICGTATYKICGEEIIGVYNHQRNTTVDGEEDFLMGVALLTEEAGKLRLFLDGIPEGSYWVMQLGPEKEYTAINEQGDTEQRVLYSYSLVSDPSRLNMFVLCRDVEEFRELYQDDVLLWLDENGFNGPLNSPIETYHGPDCGYAEPNPPFPC